MKHVRYLPIKEGKKNVFPKWKPAENGKINNWTNYFWFHNNQKNVLIFFDLCNSPESAGKISFKNMFNNRKSYNEILLMTFLSVQIAKVC